jgi:hypothetical protein
LYGTQGETKYREPAKPKADFLVATRHDPTGPSLPTIKRLFAHSGNCCAFPGCVEEIDHEGTIVGKISHIKAANPGGPRYDPQQTAAERHGYDNLVLLCGKHATVIDDKEKEEVYTVECLIKMKVDHEGRAATVDDDFAERAAQLLFYQPAISVNQAGGVTAHTVNQTINIHPTNEVVRSSGEAKPDWPIRDLFFHIRPTGFPTQLDKHTVGREVLDRFSDGQLRVWGRLIEDSKRRSLAEIPKHEWQRASFGSYWFLDEGDNTQVLHATCEVPSRGAASREYADLQVNRAQATSIWIMPQRISVLDFLTAAEADGWVFLGKRLAMHRFALGLREIGLSGTLEIWGRQLRNGWDLKSAPGIQPIEKIEPSYFREHWIDVHQAWMQKENAYTRTSLPAGNEPSFFSDLYVDRAEALNWLRGEARHIRKQVEEDPKN